MIRKIAWRQINTQNIPKSSGVYAWYYSHEINKVDIKDLFNDINNLQIESQKRELIKKFLQKNIFSYYEESPYHAIISGKLKAEYQGDLFHKQAVSESLVDNISKNPEVLYEINDILSKTDYSFMSPLYIGMAKKLVVRLKKHKSLIQDYREYGVPKSFINNNVDEISDHNFASRIITKNFSETNLYVVIQNIDEINSLNNVMENILNRINYPILGRN